MALPTAFSNNTSPTGPELDADLAALGVLTVIPCTVTGTNSLVLAPIANTPTVVSYTNYGRFSGIASATNTGPTQARVGALPLLNVYSDTLSGPTPLIGNALVIGCAFTLVYDNALNGNAGGFHLVSTANAFSYGGGTIANGSIVLTSSTLSTVSISGASISTPTLIGTFGSLATLQGGIGSLGTLQVGATSAALTRMVTNLATLSYTVVPANTSQIQTMTLVGAQVNDVVALGLPATLTTGLGFFGFVPAAGTVSVRCLNITAASIAAFSITTRATALGMV
jgi:hypothetical protein